MAAIQDVLPDEGSAEEAEQVLRQVPLRLPSYELKRVHVATLNVDYAPPYGSGYARPLNEARLQFLRKEWDPMAASALVVSKRHDNTYWVIDGNHRRYIAFEKGQMQLPAQIFTGLERAREADLYTKLGTTLGQTPWTRFQSRQVAGDKAAKDIVRIALAADVELNAAEYGNGRIQAIARVERIYGRGGPIGLDWVLRFVMLAFNGDRLSLGEMQLEGVFGFYLRYNDRVNRDEVARLIGANGVHAWHNRADSLYQRIDVGARSNTFGVAIMEMINDVWKKKGLKGKELLPDWSRNTGQFGEPGHDQYRAYHSSDWHVSRNNRDPAPQQLGTGG